MNKLQDGQPHKGSILDRYDRLTSSLKPGIFFLPKVKRSERKDYFAPHSGAEAKNERNNNSCFPHVFDACAIQFYFTLTSLLP